MKRILMAMVALNLTLASTARAAELPGAARVAAQGISVGPGTLGATEWGMSRAAVQALYPEATGTADGLQVATEVEKHPAVVSFRFIGDQLAQATVAFQGVSDAAESYAEVLTLLYEEHGQPNVIIDSRRTAQQKLDQDTFNKSLVAGLLGAVPVRGAGFAAETTQLAIEGDYQRRSLALAAQPAVASTTWFPKGSRIELATAPTARALTLTYESRALMSTLAQPRTASSTLPG